MEQKQEDIYIIKRNEGYIEEGEPDDKEDTISFELSSAPDQYWTTIFINTWEQNLSNLPTEFYNTQPKFEGSTLFINVPKTLNLRWTEEKLRDHCLLVNEYASEE